MSNYNNNFNRSKERRAPNTITLADLLLNMRNFDDDGIRRSRSRESSKKTAHKLNLTSSRLAETRR